jgi:hypothetical protein
MRRTALLVLLLGSTGCAATTAQLQSASSGQIGCQPDVIQVEDYKLGASTSSWTASCDGSKYFCSGSDMLKGVSCAKGK